MSVSTPGPFVHPHFGARREVAPSFSLVCLFSTPEPSFTPFQCQERGDPFVPLLSCPFQCQDPLFTSILAPGPGNPLPLLSFVSVSTPEPSTPSFQRQEGGNPSPLVRLYSNAGTQSRGSSPSRAFTSLDRSPSLLDLPHPFRFVWRGYDPRFSFLCSTFSNFDVYINILTNIYILNIFGEQQ
jgi:hypothetical protein